MNATDFVNAVKARNPKLFAAKKIQLSPQELEQQLKNAWWSGHEEGDRSAREEKSLFEIIFG